MIPIVKRNFKIAFQDGNFLFKTMGISKQKNFSAAPLKHNCVPGVPKCSRAFHQEISHHYQ
jgi:hypothetical protein